MRIAAAEAALKMERLAREEAEQTLQAEREVLLAVQQMQQQQVRPPFEIYSRDALDLLS